jgi:hypothetical protein
MKRPFKIQTTIFFKPITKISAVPAGFRAVDRLRFCAKIDSFDLRGV